MRTRFLFSKKDFLINQLMHLYSLLLVLIFLLIMLTMSLYTGIERYRNSIQFLDTTSLQLDHYIRDKTRLMTDISSEFTTSDVQFESLRHYLQMNQTDYFEYTNDIFRMTGENIFIPNTLANILKIYPEVESIQILLEESDAYIKADRIRPYGEKIFGSQLDLSDQLYLTRPLSPPNNYNQPIGQIFVVFNPGMVLENMAEDNAKHGIGSFIYSDSNKRLFEYTPGIKPETIKKLDEAMQKGDVSITNLLSKNYITKIVKTRNDLKLIVVLDKAELWRDILGVSGGIFLIGFLILVILLWVLNRTFKRYTLQVRKIVEATKLVSQGHFHHQIDTSEVQQELKDISEAINQMALSINDYVEDIYTLEIKQRDAQMQALQAQINPHFLYNTLEYIRMYALSRNQEELADVVYAFSALLRNNITSDKTTTLQNELDFCEKYVYLYQMRYPDKIAYHVMIDEDLENLILPKFAIQPLVENYFVHGIDYQRNDNAISIKAFLKDQKICIQVQDNGRGTALDQMQLLQDELVTRKVEVHQSIGLKNINERLRGFYGDRYQMLLESAQGEGFTVCILLNEEVLTDGQL